MKRIMLCYGTRPEVIKLAPLVHALRARAGEVQLTLCATGQHREMLDATLGAFGLRSDIDLELMQAGQEPAEFLGRLLLRFRATLAEVKPDWVVVQGDTATVMGCAIGGFLHGARIAHVEAGLRTRDKRAPFPEEVNRRVAGVVADVHFAPTRRAAGNLLAEGLDPATVFVTGNTVVDALRWMQARVAERPLPAGLDPGGRRLVLITAHRRESFGGPFRELCLALREIAERFEDVCLVYPVHLNPNVQKPVYEILGGMVADGTLVTRPGAAGQAKWTGSAPGGGVVAERRAVFSRIRLVPPVDYATFVGLLARAYLVITDSGGIQEEAPAVGKPVLVLREKTERPEAVAAGVVKLVGTDRTRIVESAATLLSDAKAYAAMARVVDTYGDGRAGERIAEVMVEGRMRTAAFEG